MRYASSAVLVAGFEITENTICGVQIGPGGGVDLRDGLVGDQPIGANIQDPAFDLSRLMNGVRFEGNDRALDTLALPIPDAAAPIDG